MDIKVILKKIIYIALLEIIIIILMFAIMLSLKTIGIRGGMISRIIPFLSILLCLGFSFFVIDKNRLNWVINKQDILVSLLFLVISVIPAVFDRRFLQNLIEGDINYGWLGYYLLVAVAEELFFRAYIRFKLHSISKKYWIITSATAFSTIHFISSEQLSIIFFFLIFLFGVIFAVTYEIINSILPLIVFHLFWNFMADNSENYSNMLIVFGIWIIMILVSLVIRTVKRRYNKKQKIDTGI
jgi:membrane protease YdiL (CAAX protease family)